MYVANIKLSTAAWAAEGGRDATSKRFVPSKARDNTPVLQLANAL